MNLHYCIWFFIIIKSKFFNEKIILLYCIIFKNILNIQSQLKNSGLFLSSPINNYLLMHKSNCSFKANSVDKYTWLGHWEIWALIKALPLRIREPGTNHNIMDPVFLIYKNRHLNYLNSKKIVPYSSKNLQILLDRLFILMCPERLVTN